MKKFFLYFLYLILNQIYVIYSLKDFQKFSNCINNKRTVEYKIKEQNISKKTEINCGDCNEGFYLYYDYKLNKTICKECPINKTNKGKNLLFNFWTEELIKQYSIMNKGWILNNNHLKSIVQKEKNETIFLMNLFFENEGEIIINLSLNYINNYSYLLIYINDIEVFSTNNEQINILKEVNFNKIFNVNKGENILKIIHKFEFNDYSKNSFILINNVLFKNIHTTAFNCNDFLPINQLNLNKCEYDNICDEKTYCIDRFYSREIDEKCELNSLTQQINYFLNENTICKEILKKENYSIPCEHCSYGQYSDYNISNIKICKECEYNKYNDEEINDENECKECNMRENRIENILYIRPKTPNYYKDIIGFKEIENKMKIEYEKFNEKEDMKVYIQIEEDVREYNEIIPEIEITKGNKKIIIKGKNINMKKIIFYGTERGSGYKCIPKLKSNLNKNLNNDIHLDHNLFYSKVYNHYMECPLFSYKIKDYCEIYPILSNNKYLTKINYKNFQLNNKEIIIDNYKINFINGINVYDTLNKISLGNELHNINIVKGEYNLGLIITLKTYNLKYMKIYESIIYIKLSKENKNKFIYENNNKYYFLIETNKLKYQCINNDFKNVFNSPCIFSRKLKILYNNNNIIKCNLNINNKNYLENPENENLQNVFLNNNNKQHKNLIEIFNIKEIVPYYPKQNSYYLYSHFNIEKCIVPKININFDFKNEYFIKFYYTFSIIFIVSLIKLAFDHENAQKRKYLLKINYKKNLFNNNKFSEIICNDILINIINNLIIEKHKNKKKKR